MDTGVAINVLKVSLVALQLIQLMNLLKENRNLRRWWVKPHNTLEVRVRDGAFNKLFEYFRINDHEEFYKFTRMTPQQFEELHEMVKHRLQKYSRRTPISSEQRLAITLKYVYWNVNIHLFI